MKKYLIFCLVVLSATSLAFSASKKKPTPAPIVPTIASVTATSITVTEGAATKTLMINQFTEIVVNGQKATVADLKPGMAVTVSLGTDPTKASRIVATGK